MQAWNCQYDDESDDTSREKPFVVYSQDILQEDLKQMAPLSGMEYNNELYFILQHSKIIRADVDASVGSVCSVGIHYCTYNFVTTRWAKTLISIESLYVVSQWPFCQNKYGGRIVLYQIWNAKGMQFIGMIGSGEAQIRHSLMCNFQWMNKYNVPNGMR